MVQIVEMDQTLVFGGMKIMNVNNKEVSYFLKHVNGIVYVEKLYWDEEENRPSEKHKAKRVILGG